MPHSAMPYFSNAAAPASAVLTPAQLSNFLAPTAWGYMLWRQASLTLLSGEPFDLARESQLFLQHCQPRRGQHWLDVGTSAGFYAGLLADQGAKVSAIDLSPAMLAHARRLQSSPLITWQCANFEQTDYPKPQALADGVVIAATLNETANPARLLQRAECQLRVGGQMWLMYLTPTGGLGQRWLGRLGGLCFPDTAWVQRQLPACHLVLGLQFGAVRFERYLKDRA